MKTWRSSLQLCDDDCNHCPIVGHPNNRLLTQTFNELMNQFGDGVYAIVQRNCPNFTVCYDCRIDDFCHVEGCVLKGGDMPHDNIDLSALARDMLKWEREKRKLDELEQAIKDAVMQLEQTQTVGNVRATYDAGRKSYDYKAAIVAYGYDSPSQLQPWRQVSYDYRSACKELEIEDIPFSQGNPSVSVKLLA